MTAMPIDNEPPLDLRLETAISETVEMCRHSAEIMGAQLLPAIPDLPEMPERWFDLLGQIPENRCTLDGLRRWQNQAAASDRSASGQVARYAVLKAFVAALPRLAALPVHSSIVRQSIDMAQRVATRPPGGAGYFDPDGDAFAEAARLVTLRRFNAGQTSFDIMGLPRSWLLRIHPLALPEILWEIATWLGGLGPIVMPHLNYWREKPKLLLPGENDRAMWRIARSIERQPEIKGLAASSWLYSIEVGRITPHLGWVRDFYRENGASLVDMELAPERMGYLVGSEPRRRLHAEGKFNPRNTLVIWRREDMLRWADAYERGTGRPPSKLARGNGSTPAWRFDANRTLSSGQLTLLLCERLMTYNPRRYIVLVMLLPSLLLALIAGIVFGLAALVPAFLAGLFVIWLFQYFFLQ